MDRTLPGRRVWRNRRFRSDAVLIFLPRLNRVASEELARVAEIGGGEAGGELEGDEGEEEPGP